MFSYRKDVDEAPKRDTDTQQHIQRFFDMLRIKDIRSCRNSAKIILLDIDDFLVLLPR